ncbi:DUF1450 domain-containing protein [Peribacillus sp. SCS-155]|uniref:DUF1450 domain-containing protein n=1 Tax=Peribacillus sedimenti TaxID=3115297 RepID=UPI003906CE79
MKSLLQIFSKKKKISIEFCQNNLDRFLDPSSFQEFQSFLGDTTLQYKEYTCMSECKLCKKSPYAKADGDLVTAETPAELLKKLKDKAIMN